ncbi:PepSY-associated TM helix domain-containing protein [Mucilaginibacter phyllosphaerae]
MLTTTKKKGLKAKKSTFRKVSEWLHLWLGLASGIIVFIVCFTGGIWVWRYEVWRYTEKHWYVEAQQKPYLAPSKLVAKSRTYFKTQHITADTLTGMKYWKPGRSVTLDFVLPEQQRAAIYMNPYTGEILKDQRGQSAADNFFIFIRAGHRFFWLPKKIGSPLVGSACIIFVITMITGLIWWYPKKWTKKAVKDSFTVKWRAKWKRLNIDIHNVVGFYAVLFVLALTLSGIFFTFDWFKKGTYKALTWKNLSAEHTDPGSDTTVRSASPLFPEDLIWNTLIRKYDGSFGSISINIPAKPSSAYETTVYFGDGTLLYNKAVNFFDQKTLQVLPPVSQHDQPYEKLSAGEKLFRMNFDIHTGQILGLPTKILAFFACMIGASMPVTGFFIWYNRKWGSKKRRIKRPEYHLNLEK